MCASLGVSLCDNLDARGATTLPSNSITFVTRRRLTPCSQARAVRARARAGPRRSYTGIETDHAGEGLHCITAGRAVHGERGMGLGPCGAPRGPPA
jgi:hypothetical protein